MILKRAAFALGSFTVRAGVSLMRWGHGEDLDILEGEDASPRGDEPASKGAHVGYSEEAVRMRQAETLVPPPSEPPAPAPGKGSLRERMRRAREHGRG